MTLHDARHCYFIGIKGVGMTALAEIVHAWGKRVSGSDTAEHFFTDDVLRARGIPVAEGFDEDNLPRDADIVIASTAYADTHPEIAAARARGLPLLTYPEAVGELMNGKEGIAVSGSHGKTTTTALLGHVMIEAGCDPTVLVGSTALNWGGNARVGKSRFVVIEADEYQNKFRFYNPRGLIITNIDWDHPDFFPTKESYEQVFAAFRTRVIESGGWVVDEVESRKLKVESPLPPALFGEHNRQNLARVYAAAVHHLGIGEAVFWKAVGTFRGTKRRFEIKGTTATGALVIDDYGHHPTEVRATLAAARARYPTKRIIAVFHPHTYTRTRQYLRDFVASFDDADRVLVLDIYGSAREQHGGVHANDIVAGLAARGRHVEYTPTIADAVALLRSEATGNELILTIGAGDVWRVADGVLGNDRIP